MTQDTHQQALEEFDDAREAVEVQYEKMRADLRFSDPSAPEQWDKQALKLRDGRPCLTFDRTNQFIAQVVNQARQNKPSIHVLPANSEAQSDVAEQLNGIIRHIEYVSRSGIVYDTAIEYAARIGLGWMRVIPEVMRPETNEQEVRLKRIHDPLSCYLEAGWSEPDGSDAMIGFIETMIPTKTFKARWPKAETDSWERAGTGWFDDKQVRICERFKIIETEENRLVIRMRGEQKVLSEDDYWNLCKQVGFTIPAEPFMAKNRTVKWTHLSGCEVLEETDFPSQYLPLIPVIGHEIWVDGKRHLCGMTRRLMDSQRAYNYERSAFIESVSMQPKAPLMAAVEAMEGLSAYSSLNQGNPAVLPFNHIDEAGNPIPIPTRLEPPAFPVAFAQGGQIATADMESAVGMFRANLGANASTAVSGRAKREDKVAGDTANFHYTDNLARSIEQLGRVVVDMIPRVFDTQRQARIVNEDGSHDFVQINPDMPTAAQKKGKKVLAINPSIGAYDVRVKTGPAYTTLREEQAEQLANIMQAAPAFVPILADLWVGAQDFPDAEKAKKRLQAMLPPQIQQMESDEGEEMSPAAMAKITMLSQAKDQLEHALQEAMQQHTDLENQVKAGAFVKQQEVQAQMQMDAAKQDREFQAKRIDAIVARQQAMDQRQIAFEKNASAERIAELNAKVSLAEAGVNQATAAQALQAEQILEEKRLMVQKAIQDDKVAADKDMADRQSKADAQKADQDRQAKADSEKAKADKAKADEAKQSDIKQHLEPIHKALEELKAAQSKPRKTMVKIDKMGDGSYVAEKTET